MAGIAEALNFMVTKRRSSCYSKNQIMRRGHRRARNGGETKSAKASYNSNQYQVFFSYEKKSIVNEI